MTETKQEQPPIDETLRSSLMGVYYIAEKPLTLAQLKDSFRAISETVRSGVARIKGGRSRTPRP